MLADDLEETVMKKLTLWAAMTLISLAAVAESPCTECYKAAQLSLASCLSTAKTDAQKKSCNTAASEASASCQKGPCKK